MSYNTDNLASVIAQLLTQLANGNKVVEVKPRLGGSMDSGFTLSIKDK